MTVGGGELMLVNLYRSKRILLDPRISVEAISLRAFFILARWKIADLARTCRASPLRRRWRSRAATPIAPVGRAGLANNKSERRAWCGATHSAKIDRGLVQVA